MSRIGINILIFALLIFINLGCEGKMGPPGSSPPGVDTTPPTIKLIRPLPFSTIWDDTEVRVEAIDNVAIREVIITVDGTSLVNKEYLEFNEPPFAADIEFTHFRTGWHYIAARAFDLAGNSADTPIIPVYIDFSLALVDTTIILSYFNQSIFHVFTLPDTLEHTKFWTRYNIPVTGSLERIGVTIGGNVGDSSEVYFEIWEGKGLPKDRLYRQSINDSLLTTAPRSITITMPPDSIADLSVENDFFIVIGFNPGSEADSLMIAADDGYPTWGQSGTYSTSGWYPLTDVFGLNYNIGISCEVYFEP